MTAKTNPKPQYELKHRLTGAGILIFTAVLVIPMLLNEPNIQASVENQTALSEQEPSFKSKIEPIDIESLNLSTLAEQPKKEKKKPALVKESKVENADTTTEEADTASTESTSSQADATNTANAQKQPKQTADEEKVVMTAATQAEKKQPEKKAEEKTASETTEKIKVSKQGWTVRVGTFAKKENVSSISSLLDSNGFSTNHTEVDTTLGKATRVWLGPYENKDTAEKVSTRLKSITGEKGYVTKQS